jgi:hypothetical protein
MSLCEVNRSEGACFLSYKHVFNHLGKEAIDRLLLEPEDLMWLLQTISIPVLQVTGTLVLLERVTNVVLIRGLSLSLSLSAR